MADMNINVGANTRQAERDIQKLVNRNYNINLSTRGGAPLGRITGQVNEFTKSLDASNARVIAFGASAGIIFGVQRAFGALVTSVIETQKSLADINVILNVSTQNLQKFGGELFNIAKNTGQSFQDVAKAATEFSRQGLGVEETLKRTNEALILSRLSGLDAAKSVEALTAAVNSYASQAVTASEVVNKFANVDAAFAVSSADLAEALARVGSSAAQSGVGLNELIAIVTSAQQTTARGGAVIGNSFKTIFTRLQRTKVIDLLDNLGVNTKDSSGEIKSTINLLTDLAKVYDQLGTLEQAEVAEKVGGVFQINILKAALADLGKEYSIYNSALEVAGSTTDQAIKRNAELNKTYAAQLNALRENSQQVAAGVGQRVLGPAFDRVVGNANTLLGGVNESDGQGVGATLGKGILDGLGQVIAGPGLALIGGVFIKLFADLSKFAVGSLKELLNLNSASKQQQALQQSVNQILQKNPDLFKLMSSGTAGLNKGAEILLNTLRAQTLELQKQQVLSAQIAAQFIRTGGVRVVDGVPTAPTPGKSGKPGKAAGYIPNFAGVSKKQEVGEIIGALDGGYMPGPVMRKDGMVFNGAEERYKYPGVSKPEIRPPEGSKAGEEHRKNLKKKFGFVPGEGRAKGFIPNFASVKDIAKFNKRVSERLSLSQSPRGDGRLQGEDLINLSGRAFQQKQFPKESTESFKKYESRVIQQSKSILGKSYRSGEELRFVSSAAVDGYNISKNGNNTLIDLLEVKGGKNWNPASVLNKFLRAVPENYLSGNALDVFKKTKDNITVGASLVTPFKKEKAKPTQSKLLRRASGFIPNFAKNVTDLGDTVTSPLLKGKVSSLIHPKVTGGQEKRKVTANYLGQQYQGLVTTAGINQAEIENTVPNLEKNLGRILVDEANQFGQAIGGQNFLKNPDELPNYGAVKGAVGTAFEGGVTTLLQRNLQKSSQTAGIDFTQQRMTAKMKRLFHGAPGTYEAKYSPDLANEVLGKMLRAANVGGVKKAKSGPDYKATQALRAQALKNLEGLGLKRGKQLNAAIDKEMAKIKREQGMAAGYIPNFADLYESALTERRDENVSKMSKGVPPSKRRKVDMFESDLGRAKGYIPNFADLYESALTERRDENVSKMSKGVPPSKRRKVDMFESDLGRAKGYIPNFAAKEASKKREIARAGSAVTLYSDRLDSLVTVNEPQIAKYGPDADKIIKKDHIDRGQVGTKSNLMKTGSGKEKYKARGFIPNFAAEDTAPADIGSSIAALTTQLGGLAFMLSFSKGQYQTALAELTSSTKAAAFAQRSELARNIRERRNLGAPNEAIKQSLVSERANARQSAQVGVAGKAGAAIGANALVLSILGPILAETAGNAIGKEDKGSRVLSSGASGLGQAATFAGFGAMLTPAMPLLGAGIGAAAGGLLGLIDVIKQASTDIPELSAAAKKASENLTKINDAGQKVQISFEKIKGLRDSGQGGKAGQLESELLSLIRKEFKDTPELVSGATTAVINQDFVSLQKVLGENTNAILKNTLAKEQELLAGRFVEGFGGEDSFNQFADLTKIGDISLEGLQELQNILNQPRDIKTTVSGGAGGVAVVQTIDNDIFKISEQIRENLNKYSESFASLPIEFQSQIIEAIRQGDVKDISKFLEELGKSIKNGLSIQEAINRNSAINNKVIALITKTLQKVQSNYAILAKQEQGSLDMGLFRDARVRGASTNMRVAETGSQAVIDELFGVITPSGKADKKTEGSLIKINEDFSNEIQNSIDGVLSLIGSAFLEQNTKSFAALSEIGTGDGAQLNAEANLAAAEGLARQFEDNFSVEKFRDILAAGAVGGNGGFKEDEVLSQIAGEFEIDTKDPESQKTLELIRQALFKTNQEVIKSQVVLREQKTILANQKFQENIRALITSIQGAFGGLSAFLADDVTVTSGIQKALANIEIIGEPTGEASTIEVGRNLARVNDEFNKLTGVNLNDVLGGEFVGQQTEARALDINKSLSSIISNIAKNKTLGPEAARKATNDLGREAGLTDEELKTLSMDQILARVSKTFAEVQIGTGNPDEALIQAAKDRLPEELRGLLDGKGVKSLDQVTVTELMTANITLQQILEAIRGTRDSDEIKVARFLQDPLRGGNVFKPNQDNALDRLAPVPKKPKFVPIPNSNRGPRRFATGYVPPEAMSAMMSESIDIANRVGGALPTDRPEYRKDLGMVVSDGEKVYENFMGTGKPAVFNRDMQRAAEGFIPDDSAVSTFLSQFRKKRSFGDSGYKKFRDWFRANDEAANWRGGKPRTKGFGLQNFARYGEDLFTGNLEKAGGFYDPTLKSAGFKSPVIAPPIPGASSLDNNIRSERLAKQFSFSEKDFSTRRHEFAHAMQDDTAGSKAGQMFKGRSGKFFGTGRTSDKFGRWTQLIEETQARIVERRSLTGGVIDMLRDSDFYSEYYKKNPEVSKSFKLLSPLKALGDIQYDRDLQKIIKPLNLASRKIMSGNISVSDAGKGMIDQFKNIPQLLQNPKMLKQLGRGLLKGGAVGIGTQYAGEKLIPKFDGKNSDGDMSYLEEVANELRSFGIATGSGAAAGAVGTGGAGTLLGAIAGGATNVVDKLFRLASSSVELASLTYNEYGREDRLNAQFEKLKEKSKKLAEQARIKKQDLKESPLPSTRVSPSTQTQFNKDIAEVVAEQAGVRREPNKELAKPTNPYRLIGGKENAPATQIDRRTGTGTTPPRAELAKPTNPYRLIGGKGNAPATQIDRRTGTGTTPPRAELAKTSQPNAKFMMQSLVDAYTKSLSAQEGFYNRPTRETMDQKRALMAKVNEFKRLYEQGEYESLKTIYNKHQKSDPVKDAYASYKAKGIDPNEGYDAAMRSAGLDPKTGAPDIAHELAYMDQGSRINGRPAEEVLAEGRANRPSDPAYDAAMRAVGLNPETGAPDYSPVSQGSLIDGRPTQEVLDEMKKENANSRIQNYARGFTPEMDLFTPEMDLFTAEMDSFTREMGAGFNPSEIYPKNYPELQGLNNPQGKVNFNNVQEGTTAKERIAIGNRMMVPNLANSIPESAPASISLGGLTINEAQTGGKSKEYSADFAKDWEEKASALALQIKGELDKKYGRAMEIVAAGERKGSLPRVPPKSRGLVA
jgi:TP901 family phage tail tape measure protein